MINFKKHKICLSVFASLFISASLFIAGCSGAIATNGFATDGDAPHVTITDQDIVLGLVPGVSTGRIIASDTNVNSVESDIWNGDSDTDLVWATDEDTLSIVSTSVLDDVGSTGAINIRIDGLDNDFIEIFEILNLDGTTPVTTVNEYARVNRIIVVDVGVYGGSNVGTIDADFSVSGNLQARIESGFGLSQKSHYTLPSNHVGIIRNTVVTVETNRVINFNMMFRSNDTLPPTTPTTTFTAFSLFNVSGTVDFPFLSGQPLNPRSDIWVSGSQFNQTATASIIIDFYIVDLGELANVDTFNQLCNQIAILCG